MHSLKQKTHFSMFYFVPFDWTNCIASKCIEIPISPSVFPKLVSILEVSNRRMQAMFAQKLIYHLFISHSSSFLFRISSRTRKNDVLTCYFECDAVGIPSRRSASKRAGILHFGIINRQSILEVSFLGSDGPSCNRIIMFTLEGVSCM